MLIVYVLSDSSEAFNHVVVPSYELVNQLFGLVQYPDVDGGVPMLF